MSVTINIGIPPVRVSSRDILNSGGMDFLGRPVFSDVWLKVGDKKILFIDALITVEKAYTITKTSMQGRSGTVKEYIGSEDYKVTLFANLISDGMYKYPFSDLQKLNDIMDAQSQIEVASEFLAIYGIHYLVPDKFITAQVTGTQNRQYVELHFESDKDIQLIIDEDNGLAPTTPGAATFND